MAAPSVVGFTLAAAFAWGVSSILVRKGMAEASERDLSVQATFITLLVNAATLAVLVAVADVRMVAIVDHPTSLVWFALAGVTGSFFGRILIFTSTDTIGAARANAIKSTSPFFATLLAIAFLGEYIELVEAAGTVLMVAGVVLVSVETARVRESLAATREAGSLAQFGVPVLAAVAYGSTTVLRKAGMNAWPRAQVGALVGASVGVLTVGAYLLATGRWRVFARIDRAAYGWFVATGVCMSVAWLSLFTALGLGRAVVVSPLKQTIPLFVLVLGAVFIRDLERVTAKLAAGASLVVLGASVLSAL